MIDTSFLYTLIVAIFGAGASFGGAKAALNGTRKKVEEIYTDVKEIRSDVSDHGERISHIEGTLNSRS